MTAAERVARAIEGKPADAYAQVRAADVIELAKAVPADRQTETVRDLAYGAEGALEFANHRSDLEVWQLAGQLKGMLAALNA